MEDNKLKKAREFSINRAGMLNILHRKIKCNIATYNLIACKSSTKQNKLIYS